jgi:hypothetical protein
MKSKILRPYFFLACFCIALFTSGCASNFNREWKNAAAQKPSRDLAGRWQGRWISSTNGHNGELRAVIQPSGPNKYHALFHATYAGTLTFTYAVDFETRRHGSRTTFCGESHLPAWAGGSYTSSGSADATDFNANYDSKHDKGKFEMKRVVENSATH